MNPAELIKAASHSYPDRTVAEFFKLNYTTVGRPKFALEKGPMPIGDCVAGFIVNELVETFEQDRAVEVQIMNALDRLSVAKDEIDLAMAGLRSRLRL